MDSFEELQQKAMEQLDHKFNNTSDTVIFRGIGYALLALAIAIKESNKKE